MMEKASVSRPNVAAVAGQRLSDTFRTVTLGSSLTPSTASDAALADAALADAALADAANLSGADIAPTSVPRSSTQAIMASCCASW
jgi:hypothetical protein